VPVGKTLKVTGGLGRNWDAFVSPQPHLSSVLNKETSPSWDGTFSSGQKPEGFLLGSRMSLPVTSEKVHIAKVGHVNWVSGWKWKDHKQWK
jgi:hypothetical protein